MAVQAPQIEVPGPDLNAGFADAEAGTPGLPVARRPQQARRTGTVTPIGSWSRVATVEVREGDHVRAGQVLVRFDSEALGANLSVARADAKVAASQVPVLDSAIEKTYDKEHSVKSALKKINNAIRQLKSTRSKLSGSFLRAKVNCLSSKRSALRCRVSDGSCTTSSARSISSAELQCPRPGCLRSLRHAHFVASSGVAEPLLLAMLPSCNKGRSAARAR